MRHGLKRDLRMCFGKKAYRTEDFARHIIKKAKQREPNKTLRTYNCPVCFKWHITSKPNEQ